MNIISANGHPEVSRWSRPAAPWRFAMDDILLTASRRSRAIPATTHLGGSDSVEPYGIMLRKDDAAFKKVVDAAMVTSTNRADQPDLREVVPEGDSAKRHQLEHPDERSVQEGGRQPDGFRRPAAYKYPLASRGVSEKRELQLALAGPARDRARRTGSYLHYLIVGWLDARHRARRLGDRACHRGASRHVAHDPSKWAVRLGNLYVEIFRNVPLIVQMFLWFFVSRSSAQGPGDWIKQMPPPWGSYVRRFYARHLHSVRVASRCAPASARCRAASAWPHRDGVTETQAYRYVICRSASASSCRPSPPSS